MHKDTQEALARLEEALLEEAPELNDEDLDALLEEFLEEDDQSFADYPQAYQNFANGYHAYNADETDEDLDVYSDELFEEPEHIALTVRIALVTALTGAVISLIYIAARCFL